MDKQFVKLVLHYIKRHGDNHEHDQASLMLASLAAEEAALLPPPLPEPVEPSQEVPSQESAPLLESEPVVVEPMVQGPPEIPGMN